MPVKYEKLIGRWVLLKLNFCFVLRGIKLLNLVRFNFVNEERKISREINFIFVVLRAVFTSKTSLTQSIEL